MIQVLQVHKAFRVTLDLLVLLEIPVLQDLRVFKVIQDLQVLPDQLVNLAASPCWSPTVTETGLPPVTASVVEAMMVSAVVMR